VATNVGGIPMQIENEINGYLIEPNNIEQLKNALLKLLKDERLRKEIGLRNKEKVIREYSWKKSAQKALGIYKSLLRKNTKECI
jgi:glycosyltransferase involved in cell wall biosynthesis